MNKEQKMILYRILLAGVLLLIGLVLPLQGIWKFIFFALPYLIIGYDVLLEAAENILHGKIFDEEFLMAVATFGAIALGEYTEAVAVMLFYQLGELFSDVAEDNSRKSISDLMALRPDTAEVLCGGETLTVPVETVEVGQTVLIRPGDRIPLDGVIVKGTTTVNTAALTGESLPRDLAEGDTILSGCINLSGLVEVKTASLAKDSTASRILSLIEDAADRKSRSETFISKFARIYTPCVVIGAVLLALLPPIFVGGWTVWLRRALIFLVASCPCALVVSVPLTFFGGIGGASKRGILIKGAEYLERMAKLRTIVLDKTGTLTKGSFTVSEVFPAACTREQLLALAATAEKASTHPIAVSLVRAAQGLDLKYQASSIIEHAGHGIEAVIGGKTYFVGNKKLMDQACAKLTQLADDGTAVYVSEKDRYLGAIVIRDELKQDAASVISSLQKSGLDTVMLTGDRESIARSVSAQLNISSYHAELLPSDKVEKVENILQSGRTTAFVGDGINDAPVLMRADVGIAMGAYGSEAALEAADIVLMNDDLHSLPVLHSFARKTMRIVRENLIFALTVKLAVLLLSALGVLSQNGMWVAVFADVGVLVLTVLNALRTFSVKT